METEDTIVSAEELYDGAETTTEIQVVEETKGATEEVKTEVEATSGESETTTEETTEADDPPPGSVNETQVPIAAVHDERSRRQAAEKENADLKAKLEESKPDPTSVFEDESKFRNEIATDFNQQLANQNLNQSEFFAAREIGRDVLDQKIATFKTLAETNPELGQRFANAVSPYHELVEIVDQHDELDKMKDLDGYKAKLKAELKAEVKQELETEQEAKDKLRESIPDSLAGDGSAGGITSKGSFEPPTAEELYN